MENPWDILPGLAAACCVAFAIVVMARLHVLPTGSDPVREGVSAYGAGPFRALYRAQVIAVGAAALLLLAELVRRGGADVAPLVLLGAFGLSRIAIAGYPTDLAGVTPTRTGLMHILLATASFVSIGVAAPWIGLWIAGIPGLGAGATAAILGVAVAASVAATFGAGLLPGLREVFGLVERAVYASTFAWLLAVAALVSQ